MTILIIAAHPDDEILGCGGTVARLIEEGAEAYAVILGEGISSRYEKKDALIEKEIKKLHATSAKAAAVLGIKKTIVHNLPDNKFDSVPLLDIVKIVEQEIQRFNPDCIFTHHGGDLNVDHTLTCRAVLTASRPVMKKQIQDIYCFQIPSATDWSFNQITPRWTPNVFYNITDTLEKKIEALQHYSAEMRPFPHPRSEENIRHIAKGWGAVSGFPAAEAFELIRSTR